jgi:ribosomal protein L22
VRPRRRRTTQKKTEEPVQVTEKADPVVTVVDTAENPAEKTVEPETPTVTEAVVDEKPKVKRSGWWRRGS